MEEITIFHKIASGELPCHKIWEDKKHLAFLSIYPNTEGVAVVIPKKYASGYFADCDDKTIEDLITAAKKVARLLDSKFPDSARTALVLEGYGVNYLHAKLYPLHGTNKKGKWRPIKSGINTYFKKYPGYVCSNDSKRADDKELAKLAEKLRK
jgi:histidine triad (HIT) family protein